MSTVTEVVSTTIEIKDAAVTQEGFGTPMAVAHHTFWADRVKEFSDASELLVAPYSVPATHPVYTLAAALKRQKPSPPKFKIGKRLGAATQIITLTPPASPVALDVFKVDVNGSPFSFTGDANPTTAEVIAGLVAALGSPSGITVTSDASKITLTATTPGARHRIENVSSNLVVKETTVDPTPTIATDLAAIRAADSDWYGLVIDSSGEAEILAAAAWAETQRVLFFPTLRDGEAKDAGVTTDVGSDLKTASYSRTIPMYHDKLAQQAGASWCGRMLPKAPGSATYANKSLAGVDKSVLSDGERAALKAKNVNYYVDIKGIGFTLDGRASSGRYADITHGMDWFEIRTQERIIGALANNDKIPFTDNGGELLRGQVVGQILEGITAGLIDGDSPWSVTVPVVAAVNPNDKLARTFPSVKFAYVLQGAVHKVQVVGTVNI